MYPFFPPPQKKTNLTTLSHPSRCIHPHQTFSLNPHLNMLLSRLSNYTPVSLSLSLSVPDFKITPRSPSFLVLFLKSEITLPESSKTKNIIQQSVLVRIFSSFLMLLFCVRPVKEEFTMESFQIVFRSPLVFV